MNFKIFPIPIYSDNYVWTIVSPQGDRALVVDPGDASPVLAALQERHLTLEAILVTHRHWDHVTGVNELQRHFACPVYGPNCEAIPQVSHPLKEGDEVQFWNKLTVTVWETPGHTQEHISYLLSGGPQPILFCGDTLFAAGCGRLLGGTAEQLHTSLERYKTLPANTQVYCTHEYTQSNLRFALAVEPLNDDIKKRYQLVENQRLSGEITLPSSLGLEAQTNPFLRCREASVAQSVSDKFGQALAEPSRIFQELRNWKDNF